jgi:cytochrome c
LGQTPFIGDVPGAGFAAAPATINVQPTEGFHDIYLIAQNPKAKAGASLMVITGTTFKTAASATAPAQSATLSVDELNQYVGKYTMTGLPFPFIDVMVKDGKLFMNAGGQEGEIKPIGTDAFDADGKAKVYFIRDESKKVTKLKLDAMGFSFEGPKQ